MTSWYADIWWWHLYVWGCWMVAVIGAIGFFIATTAIHNDLWDGPPPTIPALATLLVLVVLLWPLVAVAAILFAVWVGFRDLYRFVRGRDPLDGAADPANDPKKVK